MRPHRLQDLFRNEDGASAVLVAIAITALLGMAGLAVDGGRLYFMKTRMQNAMDAAVLAAVHDIPGSTNLAVSDADAVAKLNGDSNPNVGFSNQNTEITVSTADNSDNDVKFSFARVLGFRDSHVEASASARVEALSAATGVIPLGMNSSQTYTYGDEVTMKISSPPFSSDGLGSGNFGALNLDGNGAAPYKQDLANGSTNTISIGQVLNTQTGDMVGPTKQGLDARLQSCPDNWPDISQNCGRILLIPVYTVLPSSGNQVGQVQVVGFATFYLDTYANDGTITGKFIQYVWPGVGTTSTSSNYGAYTYYLTK